MLSRHIQHTDAAKVEKDKHGGFRASREGAYSGHQPKELILALKEMTTNNSESLGGSRLCLVVTSEAGGAATVLAQICRHSFS